MIDQRALPSPSATDILREHAAAIAIYVRPALLLASIPLVLVAAVGLAIGKATGQTQPFTLLAEQLILLVLLAYLFPIMVWREELLTSRSYLLSMPVGRVRSQALKVFAGYLWLLAILALGALGAWSLATVTGGQIGAYRPLVLEYEVVRIVPAWHWLAPFMAATIAYALGSALVVGTKHPLWWGLLAYFALLGLAGLGELISARSARYDSWLTGFAENGFGIMPLLTGMSRVLGPPPPGFSAPIFSGLRPDLGTWALAVALWGTLVTIGLIVALRRRRDI